MAGIDNNTVLYLRGDEYKDFSLYSNEKEVTNSGTTINQNGKFGPGIQLTNGIVSITNGSNRIDWSQDFTIEWWEQVLGTIDGNSALLITRVASGLMQNGILLGLGGSAMYTGTGVWNGILGAQVKDSEVNVWHHWALVKSGNLWTMYKDGNSFWTITSDVAPGTMDGGITLGAWIDDTGVHPGYNAVISELRLSNVARYSNTFIPQSEPYTTVSIDVENQINNKVYISVNKESTNETIERVDILLKGNVVHTCNTEFNNIEYEVDESLCNIGSNIIEIRAYYFGDNYKSKSFVYKKVDRIDDSTILYLRGDSFIDLSPNNYSIENTGVANIASGKFGSAIDLTVASKRLNAVNAILPIDKFTIDWWELSKGASTANTGLISTLNTAHTDTAIKGIIMGKSAAGAGPKLWATEPDQTSKWIVTEWSFGNGNTSDWVHRALVYDGTKFYAYENGTLFATSVTCEGLAAPTNGYIVIGGYRASSACYNAYVENLRISNIVRYTENFEPPTRPYTSVKININEQNGSNIKFSVTKGNSNESVSKVEVVLNDNVMETINNGFDNMEYNIDESLCKMGDNIIELRAYYYGNFYETANVLFIKVNEKLPAQPTFTEIINKLDELKTTYSILSDTLYKTLLNAGCDLSSNNKRMSTLINKVDDYIDDVMHTKHDLVETLKRKNVKCSDDNTFTELINEIEKFIFAPEWANTNGISANAADMITGRRFLTSAVIGTDIYVIGGYTGSSSNKNEKYDTITNTWTAKANLSISTYGAAAVACNGSIHHLGGYNYTTNHYLYNPTTNTWTSKAALPAAKQYSAAVEASGRIYISQGNNTNNLTYDFGANAWTQLTKCTSTSAGNYVSAAHYDGKIYVAGGASYPTYHYVYDITKNSWSTAASIPSGFYRAGQQGMVYKDKIYYIAGTYNGSTSNRILRYDPKANSWELLTTMLGVAAYGPTTQIVNNVMYCIGGYSNTYAKNNQMFMII